MNQQFSINSKNAQQIEDIASRLHDLPIQKYEKVGNDFKIILLENSADTISGKKIFGIFPTKKITSKQIAVTISDVISVTQIESDTSANDWFLTFEFDEVKSTLKVMGVLNKYELAIGNKAMLTIVTEKV